MTAHAMLSSRRHRLPTRLLALLFVLSLPLSVWAQSAARRFPSIDLGSLTASQQATFMEVVDSELCPCEGPARSLGECLEAPDGTCGLARQSVAFIRDGIRQGQPIAQISHTFSQRLHALRTPHRFDLRGVPYRGAAQPKVQMVVFSDFECPACGNFSLFAEQLIQEFGQDLRVYVMHFPLAHHRGAFTAAVGAAAAARQGKFWEFHDEVFALQRMLHQEDARTFVLRRASALGLDMEKFTRDLDDPALRELVSSQRDAARRAGADSTPSVYIDGVRYLDIGDREALRAHLRALIADAKP